MASLIIIGNTLVNPDEYLEKKQLGEIGKLNGSINSDTVETVHFTNGEVSTKAIKHTFDSLEPEFESDNQPNPHTPIGLGKPLAIRILTVYTGDYPNGIFGGKKDLMLTSAIKSSVTFDAAARAINKIDKKPGEKTYVEFTATDAGTPLVYYSPGVDALNTLVSFELVADTFEQETFDQVSKLLSSAAGLPIFLPAASYLLGGAHLIRIAGNLGNKLFARNAYLKAGYEIKFNNAGDLDAIARHVLICNDQDINAFAGYDVNLIQDITGTKFRLVRKSSDQVYDGPAPYLIISLDGQERTDLAAFTPKLASSALLQKFYGQDDEPGNITSTIEDAMQLYNDMNYKLKAEKLQGILAQMADKKGTDEYKKNEALVEAYKKNIQNAAFQLR